MITVTVAFLVTGEVAFAATIGVADTTIKLGVYYAHERLWDKVSVGRAKPPDYEI